MLDREKAKWVEPAGALTVEAKNVAKLNSCILRWPFENIDSQIETVKGLSTVALQNLQRTNETFSARKMVVDVVGTLFRSYVIKKGYLDGAEGLLMSFASAIARAFGWAKLYEFEIRTKSRS